MLHGKGSEREGEMVVGSIGRDEGMKWTAEMGCLYGWISYAEWHDPYGVGRDKYNVYTELYTHTHTIIYTVIIAYCDDVCRE